MWSNIIERATEACQQDRSGKSLETSPTGWRRYKSETSIKQLQIVRYKRMGTHL